MVWKKDLVRVFVTSVVAATVAADAVQPTLRNLSWGQLNIIHTTDTHGWLPGHLSEPQFSADWGDYISFVHHMRKLADQKGVDVLVVDTGDRHDGNGLSDATIPDGEVSQRVFMEADLDIVTVGNHELYNADVTQQEFDLLSPYFGEKYLSSNVEIRHDGDWVPMGPRYRLFNTKNQNLTVLALGFLFNFKTNDWNSRVTLVEDAVKEQWFQDVIRTPDIDVVLLAGHTPVRFFKEYQVIIDEIRQVHPTVPIQALGGHTHIRDYRVYDKYATGLQSGRFLETIGWASIDSLGTENVSFARSYVDFNVNSLSSHSRTSLDQESSESFVTPKGERVSKTINEYRSLLNLTEFICCVPQTYYTTRAKFPGKDSLFSLLQDKVLLQLFGDTPRNEHARFILVNTGSIRFDLFKGLFTRDTGYIVSPFKNNWLYIPSMPISLASKILRLLNREGSIFEDEELLHNLNVEVDYNDLGLPSERCHKKHHPGDHVVAEWEEDVLMLGDLSVEDGLTDGYVTNDDLGDDGDDAPHRAWPFYDVPNAIQATQNVDETTTHVDVIFYDFMKPFIIDVLRTMGKLEYAGQISLYGGESVIELIPKYFKTLDLMCEHER
jgi:2',3'-cyclic-nucleotide 2'-phosphodiesterase (5'-nucleotidase family)